MPKMPSTSERATLGNEIRRFRLKSGITLRKFALKAGISAAHLSDIEHDRRHPSAEALARIAAALKHVGVTYQALDRLLPRLEPEIQEWVAETPEVRHMLRAVRESRRNPREVLRDIEEMLKRQKGNRR
ncbi:MAG TPA: helix-turn-helix transcriptional regulator [Vicinamibacteria bacterium]|jgi:transcriptional regulator with XRE-family HTH domain|nr:helix-turn-helix transcriptional regulator [Vicinamibacteria bacterium]